jgi:hypothetical protein
MCLYVIPILDEMLIKSQSLYSDEIGPKSVSVDNVIRVARFFSVQHTKNGGKYTKQAQTIPKGRKIYQNFPLQVPPKFTKIIMFGLKICHLQNATVNVIVF